jgi:hypothetical protein
MLFNGHKVRIVNGYPAICINERTTVYIHQLVMEQVLGRPLKADEVVHHADESKMNYSVENLWCFRSKADHSGYHKGVAINQDIDGIYITVLIYTRGYSLLALFVVVLSIQHLTYVEVAFYKRVEK